MKTALLILYALISIPCLLAEDEVDPFPGNAGARTPQEKKLDDLHRWEDIIVDPGQNLGPDFVHFVSCTKHKHDGYVAFEFSVDTAKYEKAIRHQDLNRGSVLLFGHPERPPVLYTWLRPFYQRKNSSVFLILVSPENLKKMYWIFIPESGKIRYLYNLGDFAERYMKQ